jgi:hypothetical protein
MTWVTPYRAIAGLTVVLALALIGPGRLVATSQARGELARVRVKGTRPSVGQIFIGRGAVYYVAAQTGRRSGYVTRVTAARR